MTQSIPPVVLAFSALDPTGCGGLQADIETAASLGCHLAPIATALLSTAGSEPGEVLPINAPFLIEQARAVLEDMPVAAIKIGYVGSRANAEAIHTILRDYPQLPVILQPAFCIWDRDDPATLDLPQVLAALLLPVVELAILSTEEAEAMAGGPGARHELAAALLNQGAAQLLISDSVPLERRGVTTLFDRKGAQQDYTWSEGTPICLGACSILATAVASYRAHGAPLQAALEQAQNFTGQAMAAARQLGFGKPTPHRLFWADGSVPQNAALPAGNLSH